MDPHRVQANFHILMQLLVNERKIVIEADEMAVRLVQPEPDTIGLEFSTAVVVLNDDGTWYLEHVNSDNQRHKCLICGRLTVNYHDHEVR